MIKEFVGLTLQKAGRRAIDFWYKELFEKYTLVEFLSNCSWKKIEIGFLITYKGPQPK